VRVILEGAVCVARGHANGVYAQPQLGVAVADAVWRPLVLQLYKFIVRCLLRNVSLQKQSQHEACVKVCTVRESMH